MRPEDVLAAGGPRLLALHPLAWAFGAVVGLRRRLYDAGLLRITRVDAPVVCVGNLTTGGTGKTPTVVWLARELTRRGRRPGILSRGYRGGRATTSTARAAMSGDCIGAGHMDEARGDEARMLRAMLPDVPSVQDPDRVRGARRLIELGCDVIVLDDGFQHRRLARDVDVVLIDATRPFGLPWDGQRAPEFLLPRGLLREPARALARAAVCVVTRSDQIDATLLTRLEARLAEVAPAVPILLAEHRPTALIALGGERFLLDKLHGREVELVSGVGNAQAFETTVERLGAHVVGHRRFPDHHEYVPSDVAGLGRGGRVVVTTAKDAVKIEGLVPTAFVLDIDLCFVRGAAILSALLDSLPTSRAERHREQLHVGLHG